MSQKLDFQSEFKGDTIELDRWLSDSVGAPHQDVFIALIAIAVQRAMTEGVDAA